MNKIEVIRTFHDSKETLGADSRITGDNGETVFSFVTMELPDKHNERRESCIPAGRYFYKKVLASNAIPYEHLLLQNVSVRDGICVHRGNYFFNSKGCILVGKTFADINKDGEQDITSSKDTLDRILLLIPDEGIIDISEKFSI